MKVLKFGAVWCPACLIMRPRWQEIEKENPWLHNEYYDFDKDKEAVKQYEIDDALPTFVFLDKNGQELFRLSGEIEKKKILQILEENKDK